MGTHVPVTTFYYFGCFHDTNKGDSLKKGQRWKKEKPKSNFKGEALPIKMYFS